MKELIERLREDTGDGARSIGEIMCEAADFIEQQAAEIELLKERDDLLSSARDKLRINTSAEIHGYIAERDAALAKLSAMESVEPVAYEFRMRAEWVPNWGVWSPCNKEQHEMYIRVPKLHDWHYETRALFTAPKVAQPLTDEQIRAAYESVYVYRAVMGHGSFSFARAIEKAHNIGGQQP